MRQKQNYRIESIRRNRNKKFLQEPTLHLNGNQSLDNLEKLEERTRTRHPSRQASYIQHTKENQYIQGNKRNQEGIGKTEITFLSMNSNLTRNPLQYKNCLILEDKNSVAAIKYYSKSTKKNKKNAKNTLSELSDILKFEHNKKNISLFFAYDNLLIDKFHLGKLIPFNYSPRD